jgi:hypothetical protein
MNIVAIPEPSEESEARKKVLQAKPDKTPEEESELFNLEMRVFWNCEC